MMQMAKIKQRLARGRSLCGRAMHWWITELAGMIPSGVQARLKQPLDLLVLDDDGQTTTVNLLRKGTEECLTRWQQGGRQPELHEEEMRRYSNLPVAIRLARQHCLIRSVSLPASASSNLGRILPFEVERLAPFASDRIAFDYRITKRCRETRQLHLELAICDKMQMSSEIASARNFGLNPTYLGPALADGTFPSPFNFIAQKTERRTQRQRRALVGITLGITVACLAVALISALALLDSRIQYVNARMAKAVPAAEAGSHLREQLSQREAARALIAHYALMRTPLEMLAVVTARLPDDTWLTGFRLSHGEITLQGYSEDASRLIRLLSEDEGFTSVHFTAPVTHDRDSNLEHFDFAMSVPERSVQ